MSRFQSVWGFMNRALRRPFTTMVNALLRATSTKIQAFARQRRESKSSRLLSTEGILKRKLQSFSQAYFVSPRLMFYCEMLFLRSKLQLYRIIQIHAVKWFIRSFKNNYGLYFFTGWFGAYLGYFRKKFMFVQADTQVGAESGKGRRRT